MAARTARPISISYSSFGMYDECPRKWLLRYCKGPSYRRNHLYHQRKLATWGTFAGHVIDGVITRVMLSRRLQGKWPACDKVLDYADDAVSDALAFSSGWRHAAEQSRDAPTHRDGHQPLDRHYYEDGVGEDEIASARKDVALCVSHFMDCGIRSLIDGAALPTWWEIKKPGQYPESFNLAGAEVWFAPDLVLQRDGLLYIIDWKSGKSDPPAFSRAISQMHWYALYPTTVRNIDPARIRLKPVWLKVPDFSESMAVRQPELDTLSSAINDRHQTLVSLLNPVNGDPVNLDQWPMRPQARRCAECSFRGSCPGAAQAKAGASFAATA